MQKLMVPIINMPLSYLLDCWDCDRAKFKSKICELSRSLVRSVSGSAHISWSKEVNTTNEERFVLDSFRNNVFFIKCGNVEFKKLYYHWLHYFFDQSMWFICVDKFGWPKIKRFRFSKQKNFTHSNLKNYQKRNHF